MKETIYNPAPLAHKGSLPDLAQSYLPLDTQAYK